MGILRSNLLKLSSIPLAMSFLYRNFTARDRATNTYTHLKGASVWVDTQIWELGNSLSYITGITFGDSKGKNEPGNVFSNCVSKELQGRR